MQREKTGRAVKMRPITLGEKTRKTLRMHPLTLLVWSVCLIGSSVLATNLLQHAKYKKQLENREQEILSFQKNNKSLSDENIELQNAIQKLKNEYSNLGSPRKTPASGLDTAENKNAQTATELASALKDLEAAKIDTLKLRGDLDAKSSAIKALNIAQQTLEQRYDGFKKMLAPYLILEPTLVAPGETAMAFDGNLGIVLYEASDTSKCPKDSAAAAYFISGTDKKRLCLRTGKPESFKYQGKKYLFNLLESKENEGTNHYLISILKER